MLCRRFKLNFSTKIGNRNLRSMMDLSSIEEMYLSRSIEEKRKNYKCGFQFMTLSQIETIEKSIKTLNEKNLGVYARRISLWSGDITHLEIDAIANAANTRLLGGGGVDGTIHRAAGPHLLRRCETLKGCTTGACKLTIGFNIPAKYIIHCVGPVGEKPDLLSSCYLSALQLCSENNLSSIAFPCISTGVYGYPGDRAAKVASKTVLDYLAEHPEIERVIFCCFLPQDFEYYTSIFTEMFK